MNRADTGKSDQLVRLSGEDSAPIDGEGPTVCRAGEPEESITQRQSFRRLMPRLRVLRERGWTWTQLTELLKRAGINLAPSTVRAYYADMNAHE